MNKPENTRKNATLKIDSIIMVRRSEAKGPILAFQMQCSQAKRYVWESLMGKMSRKLRNMREKKRVQFAKL